MEKWLRYRIFIFVVAVVLSLACALREQLTSFQAVHSSSAHKPHVATVLDREGVERVWAGEVRLTLGTWWASGTLEGHKRMVLAERRTVPVCK